jgi:hypothetical protein
VTVRRITFVGNDNITDDELREADDHRADELLRLRLGRVVPRRMPSSATCSSSTSVYYDKGFLGGAGRDARA